MKKPHVLASLLLLLPLALGLSLQEDDLVFDDVGEDIENDALAPTVNYHTGSRADRHDPSSRNGRRHRFERLWGVPDTVVPVGHAFKMKIPRQAFSGNVDFYEVSHARRALPDFGRNFPSASLSTSSTPWRREQVVLFHKGRFPPKNSRRNSLGRYAVFCICSKTLARGKHSFPGVSCTWREIKVALGRSALVPPRRTS